MGAVDHMPMAVSAVEVVVRTYHPWRLSRSRLDLKQTFSMVFFAWNATNCGGRKVKQEEQAEILERLTQLREAQRDQPMLDEVVRVSIEKYTDAELFDAEVKSVFGDSPLCVSHASALREPGSYVTSDWERFPYVVMRTKSGELRAYLNQCRHRGAKLVRERSGTLQGSHLTCRYHGWSYKQTGELAAMTRPGDFPGVDKCNLGLVELPVVESGGLIWIGRTSETVLDIPKYLGKFHDDLVDFEVDARVQFTKTRVVKNANWKLLIKTYLDGYHVPSLHRDTLSFAFKKGVIGYDQVGPHVRFCATRTNFPDYFTDTQDTKNILDYVSVYYMIFPNTIFILHPDYVSLNTFWPQSPTETIWTHEMLYRESDFEGEKGQADLQKRFTLTNDTVFDQEDFAIAEEVQASLQWGSPSDHILGFSEGLLAMYQRNIDDMVGVKSGE